MMITFQQEKVKIIYSFIHSLKPLVLKVYCIIHHASDMTCCSNNLNMKGRGYTAAVVIHTVDLEHYVGSSREDSVSLRDTEGFVLP